MTGPVGGNRKKYYQPSTAITKIRHRLADGVPTHELLHYMHDRKKLPKNIRDLAEAAERLHQVRSLLDEVRESTAPDQLRNGSEEICRILTSEDIREAIETFIRAARKELVLQTMKESE